MADPDPATTAEPPDAETWAAAMAAGMQAQRDFRANNGNPAWDSDWDDEVEVILEAVWSHIAAYEHAEAEFEARADERQRAIVRLDKLSDVHRCDVIGYPIHYVSWSNVLSALVPGADLLDGGTDA